MESTENSYSTNDNSCDDSCDYLSIDEIVKKVQFDIREEKPVTVSFCERFYENISKELVNLCVDPTLGELLLPIANNGGVAGDITFSYNTLTNIVTASILIIAEFQGVANSTHIVFIDLKKFDSFCESVKNLGAFLSNNILLSQI